MTTDKDHQGYLIKYENEETSRIRSAQHSSAPQGMKCADCTMGNGVPCPDCYAAWWGRENPHVHVIGSEFENARAAPEAAGDATGVEGNDSNMVTSTTFGPEATSLQGNFIDVVFDGPPSHESGRFVEVENERGQSISVGQWIDRGDGLHALRISVGLRQMPTAWMRWCRSNVPGEPTDWDVDLVYGDDKPEGDGWKPLYSRVTP